MRDNQSDTLPREIEVQLEKHILDIKGILKRIVGREFDQMHILL